MKYLPLIIGFFLPGWLLGQQVNWGNDFRKARQSSNISKILGEDEQFIYAVMTTRTQDDEFEEETQAANTRNPRERNSIVKFDKELNLKKEVALAPKLGKKRMQYEFAEKIGGKMYTFSSVLERETRQNKLMVQEVNPQTLQLSKKPIQVATTSIRNSRNIGTFAYQLSRKKTHLLIVGYEPYERGENEKFNLSVYNRDMEAQWDKQITIPFRDELFFIERFVVDDRGDVYVLGKRYFDKPKTRRRGKPNYSYVILAYRFRGIEFEQYEINLRDNFITDLSFTVNDAGDLICAGFYSDRGAVSVKGTYYMSIDAITQEQKEEGFFQFDQNFLSQFMTDRQAARGRELYDYKLEEIILRADGGAILIAEQYFVDQVTYSDIDGSVRTRYYYNYNDIIVVSINPDKTIEWATKVPKRQQTVDDFGYFSSFAHAISGRSLYLVFNDNPRNFDGRARFPQAFNGTRSVVALVSIDPAGNIRKEIISRNRAEGIITRPKSSEQVSRQKLVIYGSRGRKYKLGEILLE
jgi:hypothetical protein